MGAHRTAVLNPSSEGRPGRGDARSDVSRVRIGGGATVRDVDPDSKATNRQPAERSRRRRTSVDPAIVGGRRESSVTRGARAPRKGTSGEPDSRPRAADRYATIRDRRRTERAEAKRLTRQALIHAGLEEIIDSGLDASLDAISARAGYTRGAFYVHFKDREDLLLAITDWLLDAIVESLLGGEHARDDIPTMVMRFLDALNAGTFPLVPRIRIAAIRLMDAVDRWPALHERVHAFMVQLGARLAANVRDAQQAGLVRRDIDAEKLGTMLTVMAVGTIMLHDVGIPIDLDPDRSVLRKMISETSTAAREGHEPGSATDPGARAQQGSTNTKRRRATTTRKR
jgi:TetR/AcrR family transcriptional regulator, transcriptional repressor for nem operon